MPERIATSEEETRAVVIAHIRQHNRIVASILAVRDEDNERMYTPLLSYQHAERK
jgi:hypothetical protein